MKNVARIILSIIFALPILVGGLFMLSTSNASNCGDLNSTSNVQSSDTYITEGQLAIEDPQPSNIPQPIVTPINPEVNPIDPDQPEIEPFDDSVFEDVDWTNFASSGFAGGDGSKENPYQISCAEDLAYMYYLLKEENGYHKNEYFVLTNDIILNDGYFEENGTYHDGGDGKLYSWKPIYAEIGITLDGQGNTIYGMYVDRNGANGAGLFLSGGQKLKAVKNINIENAFLTASKYVYAFAYDVSEVSNCSIKNSTLKSETRVGGLASYVEKKVSNCESYANIYSGDFAGGIVQGLENDAVMSGCVFGGKIISTGDQIGGMVSSIHKNTTIESCEMTGYVEGNGMAIGGFLGDARYCDQMDISNCVNHGEIVVRNTANSYRGGVFIGRCLNGNYNLYNCKNYGKTYGLDSSGSYIGGGGFIFQTQITLASDPKDTNIDIISCKNYTYDVSYVYDVYLYLVQNMIKVNINVANCVSTVYGPKVDGVIVRKIYGKGDHHTINIRNIIVNVETPVSSCSLINMCNAGKTTVKNIIVYLRSQTTELKQFVFPSKIPSMLDVKSVVIDQKVEGQAKNYYYGSDFSAFFVSWRTGKIGIYDIHGAGQWQGKVNAGILENLGYKKGA